MLLQKMNEKGLINPPKFLIPNTQYLVVSGSTLYGMETENSDKDIIGITIPHKEDIFPHLRGEILDFGYQKQRFNQWLEHHIKDEENKIEYDFTVYSIVKFFQLAMENNPNILEIIFAPRNCVLHCTKIAQLIRDNKKIFLHKGSKFKYCGYAFSQMHKMKSQDKIGKRKDIVEKYGYDIKSASHVVRLMNQGIQILEEGDLDLQRDKEKLKSIRRGEWTLKQIEEDFINKEKYIEELYTKSSLPNKPNEQEIKELLICCLEIHYGKLNSEIIVKNNEDSIKLKKIKEILES